jgi:hypothetical protein
MISSTKNDVSHYPKEIEPKQRRSSWLNRKHPYSRSRKSSTLKDTKLLYIVKSTSPAEIPKLETLYNLNKLNPKVIKSHEDTENSKSKSSFEWKSFNSINNLN